MDRLDAPSLIDEEPSQPVQQFGVGRLLAHLAEVVWIGRQAPAEVVLPDAVDHDPGSEGIARVHDPLRQF